MQGDAFRLITGCERRSLNDRQGSSAVIDLKSRHIVRIDVPRVEEVVGVIDDNGMGK